VNRAHFEAAYERTFVCPCCGSHFYATDTHGHANRIYWRGRCKGCTFNWSRSRDDEVFFYLVPAKEVPA
jgi:hypothetical protein